MAFTQGDFSAFDLLSIQANVADMWQDSHLYDQFKKPVNCFSEIFNSQTVRFDERFLDITDCSVMKLAFIADDCDMEVKECVTDACDITGEELCADEITVVPDGCFESKHYQVKETDCKNRLSFQQKVSFAMMKQLAQMDQHLLKLMYGALAGFADDLTGFEGTGGVGAVDGTTWQINPELWKPELLATLQCLTEDCMWTRPTMITNIWRKEMMLANAKDGGGCCTTDSLLTSAFLPIKTDPFFFDKEFPGSKTAFLFDAADFGYYNMYRHMQITPEEGPASNRMYKWHVNSPNHTWRAVSTNGGESIQPVKYDVYGQWKCLDIDNYAFCWFMKHHGGFVRGPKGCASCPTIIQMEQPCVGC